MRNNRDRLFAALVFLAVLFSFLFLKDRIVFSVLKSNVQRRVPGAQISVGRFIVWPGFCEMSDLTMKVPLGSWGKISVKGGRGVFRFSLMGLLKKSPLAIKEARVLLNDIQGPSLAIKNLKLDVTQNASRERLDALLKISSAIYSDTIVKDVESFFGVTKTAVFLEHLRAHAFGGGLVFSGRMQALPKSFLTELNIHADSIDIGQAAKSMGMAKRIEASGLFSGNIQTTFSGSALTFLDGRLDSATGGKFLILDTSLMDNRLAQGQAANIVIENLKNYYYDIGYITLKNEGSNALIGIHLEGSTGARHLDIIFHGGVNEKA